MLEKILSAAAIGLASARLCAAPLDLAHAKIVALNPRQSTAVKAAAMLRDEVEKRNRVTLEILHSVAAGEEPVSLIGTAQGLAEQSYRPPAGTEFSATSEAYA